MKIMITGGYDESKAETPEGRIIIDFAKKLAEQAIVQKHELRCGNLSSLDQLVIDAACDAAVSNSFDPNKVVISYHPKGQDPRTSQGGVNGSAIEHWNSIDGRRLAVPEPVKQADVLILLGGYGDASGTYTAANWARQDGTPILPIATFNMAAGNIFDDLPDTQDATKITGLAKDDLQLLRKSQSVLVTSEAIQVYAEQVISLAEKAALSRDVFVIMSFEEEDHLKDYMAAVKAVCKGAGFEAVRTDTRPAPNAHQIIDSIHEHIQACGFVIADLTNERPNVYYEIGYAMGLNKKLILTSKKDGKVHFDLQGYNRIEWSGSENLKEQLKPIVEEFARSFGLSST
ncbi:nucleoside 2-deoxyribosyltransferase [Prosthecochloris aestuarii]|uniref:nucleoside 2-deoxyribosyltransferase n=1 Tax=Prosthecochloris aestuarii TaxID=1102 RepID=UPI001427CB85|nr:nucleoside 2-deoxyribosyltransferase [Prosthecochloris aestuarii]